MCMWIQAGCPSGLHHSSLRSSPANTKKTQDSVEWSSSLEWSFTSTTICAAVYQAQQNRKCNKKRLLKLLQSTQPSTARPTRRGHLPRPRPHLQRPGDISPVFPEILDLSVQLRLQESHLKRCPARRRYFYSFRCSPPKEHRYTETTISRGVMESCESAVIRRSSFVAHHQFVAHQDLHNFHLSTYCGHWESRVPASTRGGRIHITEQGLYGVNVALKGSHLKRVKHVSI